MKYQSCQLFGSMFDKLSQYFYLNDVFLLIFENLRVYQETCENPGHKNRGQRGKMDFFQRLGKDFTMRYIKSFSEMSLKQFYW